MIIPIRCFTCNKVIAHLWETYLNQIQIASLKDDVTTRKNRFVDIEQLEQKTIEGKVLDNMGMHRYCCRRMMLSHVDLCDKI